MQLAYCSYTLRFKHPFGVSGHTRSSTQSVFVRLQENEWIGYGEACLPAYLGETEAETIAFFKKAKPYLNSVNCLNSIQDILADIDALDPACNAAKAAIDIALCDLFAKVNNQSFCDWQGRVFKHEMPTSFTIGIDTEEKLLQKMNEANAFSILKIKAGTDNDKDLITFIRKHSNKPLIIDVNQGWQNKDEALQMLEWLSDKNVILVEQPLPKHKKKEMQWLTPRSPLPLIADESVKRFSDLYQLEGAFSGINIKLMKCTGLIEAIKMIEFCKQHQLKIFLGCMAESTCATAAMAQLMHDADYVDLDAPELYLNDPFKGLSYRNGNLCHSPKPGIGVELKQSLHFI